MIDSPTRHVIVVEPNPDGHRLHYVRLLVQTSISKQYRVTVFTSVEAVASAEWQLHLADLVSLFTVVESTDFDIPAIQQMAGDLSADHVVIPDGDASAYSLAAGRPWSAEATLSVLAMRGNGQPSRIPGAAWIKTLVKHGLFLIANIRSNAKILALQGSTWRGLSLVPVVRDPVTLYPSGSAGAWPAHKAVGHSSRYWFGVVGAVGHRKNLPMIADALALLGRSDVGLVIAGRIQAGVIEEAELALARLRNTGVQVVIMDRLLEDQEMDQLIADLDCVVLAHSNEGPSGILGKAVCAGTRIVASGAKSLKRDCRALPAAAVWTRLSVGELSRALDQATTLGKPEPMPIASPDDFGNALLA